MKTLKEILFGVKKSANTEQKKEENKQIETSLTLDYRKDAWGIERIVLDSVCNHLPADSKGQNTKVKFKQNNEWIDFNNYNPLEPVEEILLEDDGEGYDLGLLSVLFSTKAADELSVGQFGEGLKLVAASCLRNGIKVEYRSKNWVATPYAKPEKIGEHNLQRLCFEAVENGVQIQGSRTRFINPSKELIEEILRLPKNVLAFNKDYRTLFEQGGMFTDYKSAILDLGTEYNGFKTIFIKGVKIKHVDSLFNYDLGLKNISPDRASFDKEKILDRIESLLRWCTNEEVLEKIIKYAEEQPESLCEEFVALSNWRKGKLDLTQRADNRFYLESRPPNNESFIRHIKTTASPEWVKVFKKIYGENAILAETHDTTVNKDAKLMGFNPIHLNDSIKYLLRESGVLSATEINNNREYKWIGYEKLTEEEKKLVDDVPNLVKFIAGEDVPVEVRIYEGVFLKSGREVESDIGVQITESDGKKYVGIKRDQLKNPVDFYKTMTHEFGHFYTGEEDYTRGFAQFFMRKLAEHYCTDKGLPFEAKDYKKPDTKKFKIFFSDGEPNSPIILEDSISETIKFLNNGGK